MSMHNASLKRVRVHWICKKRVLVPALIPIVIIIIFTAPLLFSAGWHATHSSVQRYDNYKIRVPWPYVLFKQSNSALLVRMRALSYRQFLQFDGIWIRPGNERLDINLWKEKLLPVLKKHEVNVSGSFRASMGDIQMACIQVITNKPQFKYSVRCQGEDGTIIDYIGDGDGLRQMKNLISGITRESLSEAGSLHK